MSFDFNPTFQRALDILENTRENLFITGKAGTGKSTFLSFFRRETAKHVVLLAPTGVAALNIGGQTIHSFFSWKPHTRPEDIKSSQKLRKLLEKVDMIIIDEISMVRADLLDFVDVILRLNREGGRYVAFGGVQMVFIGDLYQLPPVLTNDERPQFLEQYKSPYFFSAHVFEEAGFQMQFVEFEKIYRQEDEYFIELLASVRNNSIDSHGLSLINQRSQNPEGDEFVITLSSTNAAADAVNRAKIESLDAPSEMFIGYSLGSFDTKNLPTEQELLLKSGAQVMFVANDPRSRWVNGSIGKVKDFVGVGTDKEYIEVELETGDSVKVEPFTWEMFAYAPDEFTGVPEPKVAGTFTQYPLKLAWAITIHKSQGKTFERVYVDMGKGAFAHGQTYVALSRCRSLTGLFLKRPLTKRDIIMDSAVMRFVTTYQYKLAERLMSREARVEFIEKAILDGADIEMTYLKGRDEKSLRRITPRSIGDMVHMGKKYLGMVAYCHERKDERVFAVARILEMRVVERDGEL